MNIENFFKGKRQIKKKYTAMTSETDSTKNHTTSTTSTEDLHKELDIKKNNQTRGNQNISNVLGYPQQNTMNNMPMTGYPSMMQPGQPGFMGDMSHMQQQLGQPGFMGDMSQMQQQLGQPGFMGDMSHMQQQLGQPGFMGDMQNMPMNIPQSMSMGLGSQQNMMGQTGQMMPAMMGHNEQNISGMPMMGMQSHNSNLIESQMNGQMMGLQDGIDPQNSIVPNNMSGGITQDGGNLNFGLYFSNLALLKKIKKIKN